MPAYRCSEGHLFKLSLARRLFSLHLGLSKYACCPYGNHWGMIRLVRRSELTDAELMHLDDDVR